MLVNHIRPLPILEGITLRWRPGGQVTVRNTKTNALLGILVKQNAGPWKIIGEDSYGDLKMLATRLKRRQQ